MSTGRIGARSEIVKAVKGEAEVLPHTFTTPLFPMSTTLSKYSMGSESVSRSASIATKRGREGDESITLPRAKRHRANPGILQPLDINIQPPEKLAGSKAIPPPFPACSDVTREFGYSEREIKILKVIGSGDHAVVYRIAAGGKTFALKVVSIRTLHNIIRMPNSYD